MRNKVFVASQWDTGLTYTWVDVLCEQIQLGGLAPSRKNTPIKDKITLQFSI